MQISYFDRLLHEKHRDKQTEQFTSQTCEPIDDGTST